MLQLTLNDVLAFLEPDETLGDFLSRAHAERQTTGIPVVDAAVTLRPGVVLEIAGPSGSGKSELLAQVAAHCLVQGLAPQQQGQQQQVPPATAAAGAGAGSPQLSSVVYIDIDGKLDAVRVMRLTQRAVSAALQP
eukprot:CAMPEP_0202861996 /NCGR_PEP_ID=MMETSP1391-20130828/3205_1 /ASSEMBLY_ACC=CAM_ASM_000867 /TAXON_ID=1034604 /ORGANISM="Chlamydomonas leiostraca, Strain SAG 11-49" /LENGTH=134 /DNA_ID=CAMNT_0049541469 /DNA_START=141 /DNA_END=542 /DNA_ORIENTATION=-